MRRLDILGVRVDDIGRDELEHAIADCIEGGRKEVFAYVNVHAINIAQRNKRFREFINSASIAYCDGEGVRLGVTLLGLTPPPRVVLTRWIWDLGKLFQEKKIGVFLLGGRSDIVARAAERLRARFSFLRLKGYHHGYFNKTNDENARVIDMINRLSPSVLFVGFGMPEQELWIENNLRSLQVNAVISCGGMIDYVSGELNSAPRWMADHGLEWIHRLAQDPARMWKRYLWGNPLFLFRILLQRLSGGSPR